MTKHATKNFMLKGPIYLTIHGFWKEKGKIMPFY